jgi:hypothetical protein
MKSGVGKTSFRDWRQKKTACANFMTAKPHVKSDCEKVKYQTTVESQPMAIAKAADLIDNDPDKDERAATAPTAAA